MSMEIESKKPLKTFTSRPSVIKTLVFGESTLVDIIKTNHFVDDHPERKVKLEDVLSLVEKSLGKAMLEWGRGGMEGIKGILQEGDLNVMFGIHWNSLTRRVDFEVVSAIVKADFFAANLEGVVVIRHD